MKQWVEKVRKWLGTPGRTGQAVVAYEVACSCGYLVRGFRHTKHQVARCPDCGRNVFVLPASPLPPVAAAGDSIPSLKMGTVPAGRNRQRIILFAVLAAAPMIAGVLVLVVWLFSRQSPQIDGPTPENRLAEAQRHVAAGEAALADGSFQSAVKELEAARIILTASPRQNLLQENQHLTPLYRQAALLADLLTESLEEILNRIDGLEYKEGQAAFARRYRGKAVVFYSTVRQDAAGRHQMDYRLFGPRRKPARLELADLKLLHTLPLDEPQLLLFGARLDKVSRDPDGAWVFSLEPDSGVLITHPGAAAACCFQPPDDAKFQVTLKRQTAWQGNSP